MFLLFFLAHYLTSACMGLIMWRRFIAGRSLPGAPERASSVTDFALRLLVAVVCSLSAAFFAVMLTRELPLISSAWLLLLSAIATLTSALMWAQVVDWQYRRRCNYIRAMSVQVQKYAALNFERMDTDKDGLCEFSDLERELSVSGLDGSERAMLLFMQEYWQEIGHCAGTQTIPCASGLYDGGPIMPVEVVIYKASRQDFDSYPVRAAELHKLE